MYLFVYTYLCMYSRAEIKLAFEAQKFESRADGRVEVKYLFLFVSLPCYQHILIMHNQNRSGVVSQIKEVLL